MADAVRRSHLQELIEERALAHDVMDSTRVARGLVGSSVRVTLEIEAEIPDGAPGNVVRTVTENSRTLKFGSNSGFEVD